jgi:thiol:disulfide interchange protein DsbD
MYWHLLISLLLAAIPALGSESAPLTTPHATVTLVSASDSVAFGAPLRLGLRFKLAPGWHIYWSNPGDAGQAPALDLKLPDGATRSEFQWPVPQRIGEGPVMTFAYTGEVLLPFTVTGASGPLALAGNATWLICQKVCVPEEGKLDLTLPAGDAAPSPEAALFQAADNASPRPSPFAVTIAPDGTLTLSGDGLSSAGITEAAFFPTATGVIVNAAPQVLTRGDHALSLALKPGDAFDPHAALSGIVVLKDRSGQQSAVAIAATPGAAPPAATGLAEALLFAFLGGLILNLMPCVFPVLAMKAMAIVRLSGNERRHVRIHALWYAAGVLAAFGALAVILLAVRAAGGAAVWGFQFQSPLFVAGTAFLLFLVGLNLSGVFAIGTSITGIGQSLTARGGHAGSFFTGALAVLVATPCTAPFMGAAIASALSAPAPVALTIFLMMGLGLAAPYSLLAIFPGLAGMLPRPGRWMDVLKQGLAFPMYAATAWLIWVLSQSGGASSVAAAGAALVALGFAAWAYGLSQAGEGRGVWLGRIAAVAGVIAAAATLPLLAATAETGKPELAAGQEPYSAEKLSALRAEGKPVFVNMTAAWCVTCLVNEEVALAPQAVREAFVTHHVAYLKGDWTKADPAITAFLHEHQRDGVPLYVFYPPDNATPIVLPQVLTPSVILDQLERAGS